MNELSPAAQAFWGGALRHLLTLGAGVLVHHGYASATGAQAYTEELSGVVLAGAVQLWANRAIYWQQIRTLVAQRMPANASALDVAAKVDQLATAKTLPPVLTPAHLPPSVAVGLLVALLGAGMLLPACTAGGGLKIGKLDLSPTQVQTILSDASAGLADACASSGQTFPNATECAIGTTALSGVAAAAANSATPATAASAGIAAAINTQPGGSQLLPYLQAAADLLPAVQSLIK